MSSPAFSEAAFRTLRISLHPGGCGARIWGTCPRDWVHAWYPSIFRNSCSSSTRLTLPSSWPRATHRRSLDACSTIGKAEWIEFCTCCIAGPNVSSLRNSLSLCGKCISRTTFHRHQSGKMPADIPMRPPASKRSTDAQLSPAAARPVADSSLPNARSAARGQASPKEASHDARAFLLHTRRNPAYRRCRQRDSQQKEGREPRSPAICHHGSPPADK